MIFNFFFCIFVNEKVSCSSAALNSSLAALRSFGRYSSAQL